ncbi:MAG: ribonuclease R, partial [Chitinophagales bacterium]|nr:ribonuclease R [Chitinophagales bacterium]
MKKKHKKKNKAKGEKTEVILLNIIQALGEKATYHNLVALLADDKHEDEVAEALEVLIENSIITIDKKGRIIYNSSNSQKDTPRKNIYRGTVDLTPGGAAYIVCEDLERDIYVPPRHVRGVLHGDEVLVQIISKDKKRPEGRILEIIKRGQESFIGKLFINNKKAYVAPEGKNIRFSINIPLEQALQFRNHSKVIARVTDWGKHGEHPTGEVLEQLGSLSPADKEMKMILVQNGFHTTFPDAVIKEAVAIPQTVTEKECKGRLDYRDILTFTIDPVDAKDFDDAISFRKVEDGNIEIGVHIADVSHYVKENSAIDKEAMLRGTSVYLPDRVCPMLPEHLSNIVCSLRPNEDKLAFSVIFIFDKKKEIKDVTIAKTVICSKRRFTYEQVQEILEIGKGEFAEELNIIHSITKHIRHKRMKAGAIAFEKEEVRFRLDDSGTPLELYIKHRKDAHLLIEDLMLLANETIARYGSRLTAGKKKGAFVYRVHDKPDPFKLEQFAAIAARYGYNIRFDANDPAQVASTINALMKKVKGRPEEHVLEQMAIRSMAKAHYTTNNIGHYGLAMTHY